MCSRSPWYIPKCSCRYDSILSAAYVPAPSCRVLKDAILEADIIAIHKNGIAAEGTTLRAVGHILPGVMRTAEGFVFYCKVAFAYMYLGHNGTLLYKYIISIKKL